MKKILIILCLILLSGCEINYDMKINEDMTFNENIRITAKENYFIENIPQNWDVIKSKYNYNESKYAGNINANLTKSNSDLLNLTEDELVKKYVGKVKITEGSTVKIVIIFNDFFWESIKGNASFANSVKDLTVKLDIPFKVVNANNTSKEGNNTYIWKLNKDFKSEIFRLEFEHPKKVQNFFLRNAIIITILVVLLIFIASVYLKYKKNNEI